MIVLLQWNNTQKIMKTEEKSKANIFQRILDDKKAIRECIANHGNLKQLADERHIQFAAPL